MKPLSIADYLDRLGSAAGEKAPPRPEGSPFRPRSLPSPQNGGVRRQGRSSIASANRAARRNARGGSSPTHAMGAKAGFARVWRARVAADGRAGQARGHVGQARRRLCARPRARSRGGPRRGLGPPRGRARRCAGAGGNAAAGVSSQRIRGARRRDPVRVQSRSRTMSAPPSPASSRRFSRKQVVKRAVDELAKAIARICASSFARIDQDSRTRARACALAPANRRSADRGRICRG